MLRKIIRLGVLLLIVHGIYRSVPLFLHYYQFRDAVREAALFSKGRTDVEIAQRVMELARKYDIPLESETIQIRRESQTTYIEASYVQDIEWLPTYKKPYAFTVSVDAMSVRPTTADDIIR